MGNAPVLLSNAEDISKSLTICQDNMRLYAKNLHRPHVKACKTFGIVLFYILIFLCVICTCILLMCVLFMYIYVHFIYFYIVHVHFIYTCILFIRAFHVYMQFFCLYFAYKFSSSIYSLHLKINKTFQPQSGKTIFIPSM